MAKDPLRYFRVEARELLDQLGRGVLQLERDEPEPQAVAHLLRLAHTLKGAARVVKQREMADRSHTLEDVLGPLRDTAAAVPRQSVDAALALVDDMSGLLAKLGPQAEAQGTSSSQAAVQAPRPAAPAGPSEPMLHAAPSVGADVDGLLQGMTRTHAHVAALRDELLALGHARRSAAALAGQLAPRRQRTQAARDDGLRSLAEQLHTSLDALERNLAASADQIDRELRDVRDATEQLSLVPAANLFTALERTARDAAQALGKRVRFVGNGGGVRLDAALLRAVQPALVQLVRNAVAHGIEAPALRSSTGKPSEGRIDITVQRRGRHVELSCTDDGAGVDLDAVRHAAQRTGRLTADIDLRDPQSVLQLLLRGGLSTAGSITEVAGRGIGLDVVRDAVDRLRGEVRVNTSHGAGTTLVLRLPLTIAALDTLMVEAAGAIGSIPLDAVRRTLRYATRDIAALPQGQTLVVDGQALPFISLARVLRSSHATTLSPDAVPGARSHATGVVVSSEGGMAVVGVDGLRGIATAVLRPLPDLAPASRAVAGVSMSLSGQPQLVFDPDGLVHEALQAGLPEAHHEAPRVPLLVVDDSLTTRMLEQSILESAGYTVHAAVSAEDGLERAQRQRYALFLVDVDMPGMDGFTFIERTRSDPALRHVPAILVTSRNSEADRQRGRDVGAQGYIVKSEFAQAEFLQRVRELIQ